MQLLHLLLAFSSAVAFYLPGVAPREYADGDRVEIKVHKLSSPKTQLPYDYYSLPFCRPEELTRAAENLGEVMSGAIIQNSPYDLYMGKSEFRVACRSQLDRKQKQALSTKVRQDYRVHMIMDNLPAATKMIAEMPDGTKKDMCDSLPRPMTFSAHASAPLFPRSNSDPGMTAVSGLGFLGQRISPARSPISHM